MFFYLNWWQDDQLSLTVIRFKTGPVSTIFGARNLKDAEKDETDIEFLKSATDANLH